MSTVATIRARDVALALMGAKLRKCTSGRTCQLCALSEAPMITVDCHYGDAGRRRAQADATRFGINHARTSPMQRGEIVALIERVQREHGRPEVLRTWGTGLRTLQLEPRYVLNGGSAA